MNKVRIHSDAAPQAVGTYSQAIRVADTVYLSGQLGIDPADGTIADAFSTQATQAIRNLDAVCKAAGGGLNDIVRLGVFLTDLSNFAELNQIMSQWFSEPYPARSAVQVAGLPKAAAVEIDAIMVRPLP